ncbi:Reverse transcriptase Ty1/copia-type domain-containing protein, partial [Durusdinium trenchii]
AKYKSQWRPGVWLGKDNMDHDLAMVNDNEIVETKAIPTPVPELLADVPSKSEGASKASKGEKKKAQAEGRDADADDVLQYAREHPEEDVEIEVETTSSKQGGASAEQEEATASASAGDPPTEAASSPKRSLDEVEGRAQEERQQKGRYDHFHLKKKAEGDQGGRAKMVHFDPDTPIPEPSTKAPRTSGSTTAEESKDQERHTRRVEEVEIYVEDDEEVEAEEDEDSYDWSQTVSTKNEAILNEAEMKRRGFYSEGGGPPQVDADELRALDQQAMLAEVERLNDLTVIANLEPNDDVEEAMKLDTRIVFDWRFRSGCWVRRARLVAREFRSGAASSIDTFSPTSPLSFIKLLMSLSVTMNLMISVMDISDAFLQVVQKEFVVIEVPAWIREILGREDLVYWKLLRCLPGQRNAALERHKHFSSLCAEFLFQPYKGGTIHRHEKGRQFLSVHVDDIILVAEEQNHHKFLEHFSKILKMKADGPYGMTAPGTLFYFKRNLTFDEQGLEISASSKYAPKLLSMLKLQD